MESVKEVELESALRFPVTLLVPLEYLALDDVDLDTDEIHSTSLCVVTLEGLYLLGVSPGVIKILTKTLSNSADAPHYAGWRWRQLWKTDSPRQSRS